jgi:hypothetical protein
MTPMANSDWRERLASPLAKHYIALAFVLAIVVALAIRLGIDWAAINDRSNEALATKQVELKSLEMQTAPLRGLNQRVGDSREQMKAFYAKRIPASYSSIATRFGELEIKSGVRLSRLQYAQGATTGDLTEISMDAGISGQYPQIMRFINGLERDQTFFVIRAMALTGQQGGMVNLRLRVSTWLRPANVPSGLPTSTEQAPAGSASATQEGE